MRYELKPLGVGGILDQAIQIFKDRVGLFVILTLILRIPATAVLQYAVLSNMSNFPMQPNEAQLSEFWARMGRLYLYVLGPSFLVDFLLVSPITNAAVIYAAARIYLGEKVSFWLSVRMALRRYFPFLWTSLLFYVIVFVGTLCFILPGILMYFRFALAPTATVLERVSGFGALSRSGTLMQGDGYGNYVKLFLLVVALAIMQWCINAGSSVIPELHVQALAFALFGSISFAFVMVAQVVFYYSCRCRNEGFDLLYLARLVAETPAEEPLLSTQG